MTSVVEPLTGQIPAAKGGRAAALMIRPSPPARAAPRASQITRAGFVVWVPFWLALGIGLWFSLRQEPGGVFYAAVTMLFLMALAGALLPRLVQGLPVFWAESDRIILGCVAICLIAAGVLIAGLRSHVVAAPVMTYRYYGPVEGRVVMIDRSARDRVRITLDTLVLRQTSPARTPEKVRISLMGGGDIPEPGAHVMLTAHLGPPPGPAEPEGFDFRRMAWFESLGGVGYTRTPVLRAGPPQMGGAMALHRLRMQLSQAMQDRIGGQAGAVAAALMTGDRSGITEATNEIMRISSLYHIISISGLHMTMLAAFVYGTLRFGGLCVVAALSHLRGLAMSPPLHKIAAAGAIVASAGYLWLSGGGVATERAFIMVSVMLFAILVDMRAISLRTVAIAAVIVLVLGPEALTTPGFHMSFAATVALVLMARPWQAVSSRLPRWSHALILLFLTSIFAGLATGPLAAAQFGRIAPYGLLANALVVPVMGALVMNMGVIALFLAPFGLEGLALWVMGMGTTWMLWVAEWIAGWNGADLMVRLPPATVLPMIGAGMMLVALTARRLTRWRGYVLPAPVFSAGLMLLIAGFSIWLTARRPDLLIAAQGDAVGLMTRDGRAMSKASGGAFSAQNWLADDGETASQTESSERPAGRPIWSGPRNLRQATVDAAGRQIRLVHATGKSGPDMAAGSCRPGTVIILDSRAEGGDDGGCVMIDLRDLQKSGAIAIWFDHENPEILTAAQANGNRSWTQPHARPRSDLTEEIAAALTGYSGK